MITIKNVKTLEGEITNITLPGYKEEVIEAKEELTLFPAMIDPQVSFRVPGAEHEEKWHTGALAAIAGGVTTVFDMPNNLPFCNNRENLHTKKTLIDQQLQEAGIPLRYHLYLGVEENSINEIGRCSKEIIGIKVYMGTSRGQGVMTSDEALDKIFRMAAQENMLVAVHAEDESIIEKNKEKFKGQLDPSVHSKIRTPEAAAAAVEKAIALAEKYGNRLVILHISTRSELELIRKAKEKQLLVYCEVSPQHLFLYDGDYAQWGTRVLMNPPLRSIEDQTALWEGVRDGTVDMIGSDHAPHTLEEKKMPYGNAPLGVPSIETTLPLLLTAYKEKKITLERIVALTHVNVNNIFELKPYQDVVLVDMNKTKTVTNSHLKTKCAWSPYEGRSLTGWPVYTIFKGHVFHVA